MTLSKLADIDAPGCWGSVIVFDLNPEICANCTAHKSCGTEANRRKPRFLELIERNTAVGSKKTVSLYVKKKRKKKTAHKPETSAAAKKKQRVAELRDRGLPLRPAELIASLEARDIDISMAVNKENPMKEVKVYPFMRIGLDLLIEGEVTRSSLISTYLEELNFSETTARTHAAMFFSICRFLKIATFPNTKTIKLRVMQ